MPGVGSITITPPPHKESEVSYNVISKIHASEQAAPANSAPAEDATTDTDHTEASEEKPHGKIPLLRGATADLNTTIALALVAFFMIQYYGFSELGFVGYAKKFINISNPINFFIGILELVSEFSKILSFAFRLFGNIFAGEVLLGVIAFLVPILASFPFLIMEVFVGLVQALVFSMLTGVFISSAVASHDDHH
ncbi:MAG: ATP synthase subunit a [Microgenomates bacterium OLB23]|nr:MAG: ATP synthase subunit a [Microgenomates bacterium OLB23]